MRPPTLLRCCAVIMLFGLFVFTAAGRLHAAARAGGQDVIGPSGPKPTLPATFDVMAGNTCGPNEGHNGVTGVVTLSQSLGLGIIIGLFHGDGTYTRKEIDGTGNSLILEAFPDGPDGPAGDEWIAKRFTLTFHERVAPRPIWSINTLMNDPVWYGDASVDATFDLNDASLSGDGVDPHPDVHELRGTFHCADEAGYGLLKSMGLAPAGA